MSELTASLFISFSSSLPISRMQISFNHLHPSNPPKINSYLVPITHAVCLYLPAGAFSLSTGWLHLIVSVLSTYKSFDGIIFLNDLPLPSYPPKRYILLPISEAVWPRSPFGGVPKIYGSVQVKVSVSKMCRSLRCLLPECPPNKKSLLPSTVIVCAFLAIGYSPQT